jgi:hypothetical protein
MPLKEKLKWGKPKGRSRPLTHSIKAPGLPSRGSLSRETSHPAPSMPDRLLRTKKNRRGTSDPLAIGYSYK